MKYLIIGLIPMLVSLDILAEEQQVLTIASTCQIRSIPGGVDGSTVEYTWKITAKPTDDRVLSVEQITRNKRPSKLPDLRGYQRFLFCEAGNLHEKEFRLEVDQGSEGGERSYCFEGFLTSLTNEDIPLPESADVDVTTRQFSDEKESGHLVGVTVSQKGRELSRHYIFISFISLADLKNSPIWSELTEQERELRDGKIYQDFTEAKSWEPRIRQFTKLDK